MQIWLILSLTGVTRWLAIRSGLWSLRRFCCQFLYFVYHHAWLPDVYLWCLIVFHFFAASRVGFCSRYVWYHLWYQDQDTLLLRVVRVWQYTTPQLDSALFSILRSASYPQSKLTRFQNFSIFPTTRKRLFHPCWKLTTISNLNLLSWPFPHHGKLPNPGNSDSWHLWRKGHRCVATGGDLGKLSFL